MKTDLNNTELKIVDYLVNGHRSIKKYKQVQGFTLDEGYHFECLEFLHLDVLKFPLWISEDGSKVHVISIDAYRPLINEVYRVKDFYLDFGPFLRLNFKGEYKTIIEKGGWFSKDEENKVSGNFKVTPEYINCTQEEFMTAVKASILFKEYKTTRATEEYYKKLMEDIKPALIAKDFTSENLMKNFNIDEIFSYQFKNIEDRFIELVREIKTHYNLSDSENFQITRSLRIEDELIEVFYKKELLAYVRLYAENMELKFTITYVKEV